jgi:transcriptional regulator with XRE-family HTH domain
MSDDLKLRKVLVPILRTIAGLSVDEMAAASGLTPRQIRRYESGRDLPTDGDFQKLKAASGLPPAMIESALLPLIRLLDGIATQPELQGTTSMSELIDRAAALGRLDILADLARVELFNSNSQLLHISPGKGANELDDLLYRY